MGGYVGWDAVRVERVLKFSKKETEKQKPRDITLSDSKSRSLLCWPHNKGEIQVLKIHSEKYFSI